MRAFLATLIVALAIAYGWGAILTVERAIETRVMELLP